MLKSDYFPNAHLSTLSEQINNWLGDMIRTGQLPSDAVAASTSYELGEQFLMVSMKDPEVHAVKSLDRDLGELVTLTGRRHHQLKYKQMAVAYARSLVAKDDALCQLFATRLAPHVQEAIEWLDKLESEVPEFANGSWRVRLVSIPTFHTHAFLIQQVQNGSDVALGNSYVFVVSAPDWVDKLPRQRLLTSREFLLGFKDKTPIIGIGQRQRIFESRNKRSDKPMVENNDTIAEAGTTGASSTETGSALPATESGSRNVVPAPIFESFIYDFVNPGLGGDPGGKPGTIGGQIGGQDPKFRVLTYPFMPPQLPDIENT